MALDRQSIEKKDFPIGRRGYDPDAVDAHLTSIAEQLEEFKSAARRRADSLAETASEQVRMIVEAAENSANQIRADAEKEARDIRRDARSEAANTREEATAQAGTYVSNVSTATATTLERVDAIESELGGMLDALRTSVTRAKADLSLLENHLVEVRDAVTPRPAFEPDPAGEPQAMPELGTPPPSLGEPAAVEPEDLGPADPFGGPSAIEDLSATTPPAPVEESSYESVTYEQFESESATSAEPQAEYTDDTEGARLIALNMALNGTPREEVDRYLAENFDLNDRAGLIEEVYSSVEG